MTEVVAGPPALAAPAQLLGAVLCAVGVVPADGPGAFLLVVGALGLLGSGVRDLVQRPVLRADAGGLVLAQGLGHRTVAWTDLERVQVVVDRRAPLLELDLGDAVHVLSRRRLGRSPQSVLDDLEALRP